MTLISAGKACSVVPRVVQILRSIWELFANTTMPFKPALSSFIQRSISILLVLHYCFIWGQMYVTESKLKPDKHGQDPQCIILVLMDTESCCSWRVGYGPRGNMKALELGHKMYRSCEWLVIRHS